MESALIRLLKSVPDAWGPKFGVEGGAVTRTRADPNEIAFKAPAHMALVMFTPQADREIALNSDRRTLISAPIGTIEIVPAEAELFARWHSVKDNLLVALVPSWLTQLAGAEFENENVQLQPARPGFVDRKALLLGNLIREEFQSREVMNELCFDSLVTLFGVHLLRGYSSLRDRPDRPTSGGLSSRAFRTVTDYMQANLSQGLSVSRLAEIAGLSPSHFLRAFRGTSGQAPHQYVVAQRVLLVERLVLTTDMSLPEIAKAAGFSTSSHMTATVKRLTGITPSHIRRSRGRLR
jgi:AraC family transcriptional regulator